MQNAETVLSVIRDRGSKRLPLDEVYRQLYNPDLYLRAYGRLYANKGAMTPGVTDETVDGMSQDKVGEIIEAVRYERFRWLPARRTQIPKKNGKMRPLGIPTWRDKLLQEVMRSLLDAYYEPQFSKNSHGFRPERGCHTALRDIQNLWTGTRWFIEFDIKGYFDNIDHTVLMSILREKIKDNRFLRLIENMLKAGYCEQWKYRPTLSGTPQGGVISPLLANIYLDQLDRYVQTTLQPEYTRGTIRRKNPEYLKWQTKGQYHRKRGEIAEAEKCRQNMQRFSCVDAHDPNYRRLRYIRYADDFLLGFTGPKEEAEAIKDKVITFLRDTLHLEVSPEKTKITHAVQGAARFLNYEIVNQQTDTKHDRLGRRAVNGRIGLRIPMDVVDAKCARYSKAGKSIHRVELTNNTDYSIVVQYQSEYRGYVQYYKLAQNLAWMTRVKWYMESSLLKTLACKHKTTLMKVYKRYRTTVRMPEGLRRVILVRIEREGKKPLVAYFGGISLRREKNAVINDQIAEWSTASRTELEQRLLADRCEVCGSMEKVEVHHIRKLADLHQPGRGVKPLWMRIMSARKRKTLIVCRRCHEDITYGRPLVIERKMEEVTGEPDDAKVSRPVRRGLVGKGAEQ